METVRPTFEEWAEYCFTLARVDSMSHGDDEAFARQDRFLRLPPRTVTEFISRLFEGSARLARGERGGPGPYTNDQIGDATWFLFGASGYFQEVRSAAVPKDLQLRCFRSVTTLYLNLYDRLCNHGGHSPDDRSSGEVLDGAVYMIWDMDCIEGAVMFPDKAPHLAEAGFEILETVLERCRTGSCLKSALHGLGHIAVFHPDRVSRIVGAFLDRRESELPEWLAEYARRARYGGVR